MKAKDYIIIGSAVALFLLWKNKNKKVGTSTGATTTGDATAVLKEADTTLYFCTTGQAFEVLQSYIKAVANNMNAPQEVKSSLLKVIANYNVVDFTAAQQYGFDLQYMQNLLDEIQEYYAELPWQ
jgi:hypothetical protein